MKKIKIGCAYAYPICKYGYPPAARDLEKSLREISLMGFRYTELEGLGRDYNYLFSKRRKYYQQLLLELDLQTYNYCIVDPELVSPNISTRKKAYELYEIGCENAAAFGAETIHIATYTPPLRYRKIPYRLKEKYNFGFDYRAEVPKNFDWKGVWSTLVESCRKAAETADRYDLDVLVEPRVGEVVSNTEAMLMLLKEVQHPRLKANFDFAHLMAQRETLSLSWKKLEPHIGGIHLADNNTKNVEHTQIGSGSIDWKTMLKLIAGSNFEGYMGIDLFVSPRSAMSAFRKAKCILGKMVCEYGLMKRIEVSSQPGV